MLKRMLFTSAIVGALFGVAAPSAEAALLDGSISFAGSVAPTGGTDWGSATGIDFGGVLNYMTTIDPQGDFVTDGVGSGIPTGFQDFTFVGFAPVANLWGFFWGGSSYTFDLNTLNIDYQYADPFQSALVLSGTGIIKVSGAGANYDPTPAAFIFSAIQSRGSFVFGVSNSAPIPGDGGQGCISYPGSCDPTPTPEPGSLVLLGTGLVGAARAFRKKQSKEQASA